MYLCDTKNVAFAVQPFGFNLSPVKGKYDLTKLCIQVPNRYEVICKMPTMEEPVIDSDVFVIDSTVEGESDHHWQVGDLSKAL